MGGGDGVGGAVVGGAPPVGCVVGVVVGAPLAGGAVVLGGGRAANANWKGVAFSALSISESRGSLATPWSSATNPHVAPASLKAKTSRH